MNGLKLSSPSFFLIADWAAAWDMVTAPSPVEAGFGWIASAGVQKIHLGQPPCRYRVNSKVLTCAVLTSFGLVSVEAFHIIVQLLLSGLFKPNLKHKWVIRRAISLERGSEMGVLRPEIWIIKFKLYKNGKLIKLALLIWCDRQSL